MVRRRTAELQKKNRELEAFVYTVSHDLKAPVVSLQGMASVLKQEYERCLDEEGRHYLQRVIANANHMEALIQNLLRLSKIGRVAYVHESVDSEAVVREVLGELDAQIQERGIQTIIRSPLPPVGFNRMRLYQVFSNLIGNAVKFMGETPDPLIEIGAESGEGHVQFYVRDNGIGIEKEYHEKIFNVFQQLKEIETEGTGIGLSIVRKIADSCGGRVWVESEKGRGATFHFWLPSRASALSSDDRPEAPEAEADEPRLEAGGRGWG
jgi:signal transduction histidine kinase